MKKIWVIGVMLVLIGTMIVPSVSSGAIDDPEKSDPNEKEVYQPKLEIRITDSATVEITNVGDEPVIDIECEVWFDGLVLLGDSSMKINGEFLPGKTHTVKLGLVFGIGRAVMHACATASNVDETVCDELGLFILGTFIFIR